MQLRSHSFQAGTLARETAVLDDGLAVTIHQYGCAHFVLEVVFASAELHSDETALQAARRLMQRLSKAAPDFAIGQRFLEASASQDAQMPVPIELVEVDGYSRFVVDLDDGDKLVVTYDVAL